jgi:hypothetical protein
MGEHEESLVWAATRKAARKINIDRRDDEKLTVKSSLSGSSDSSAASGAKRPASMSHSSTFYTKRR